MSYAATSLQPQRVGFLLVEGYALMSAAAAIEPLRAANLLAGRKLYDVAFFSKEGGAVEASCGGLFQTRPLRAASGMTILHVVAGGDPLAFEDAAVLGRLRALAAHGTPLGGISGGAAILVKAGLMENRRFTVHWEHFEALRAVSDALLMERRLFVIDRDRFTCAGGTAPLDMMHALIRSERGAALAQAVSDWFIHTGIRRAEDPQPRTVATDGAPVHPIVTAALDLMATHIADPLSLEQLAMLSGVSGRQLQRRFDEAFGTGVMRQYMMIRIRKAEELLRQTRLPISEVGQACGFANDAHFAKTFRSWLGHSPSRQRRAEGR